MEGWMERRREGGRECGSAGQIRLRGFFFSLHEIVLVLLKCMFEVGAQLSTSCVKRTDARVEQEMREANKRERERGLGEDRKGSMRKTCEHCETNIWKEHEVLLQTRK